MIRIIVRTCDAGMAANVGGEVVTDYKTFDVELPDLESFLREPITKKLSFTERRVQGIELKDDCATVVGKASQGK